MIEFIEKWNKAEYFYFINEDTLTIERIENKHHREQYEDMYYCARYFFTLSEAKKQIKERKPYTPEGHSLNIHTLKDYKIIN